VKKLKVTILIFSLASIYSITIGFAQRNGWSELNNAWTNYVKNPSQVNAKKLYAQLSNTKDLKLSDDKVKTFENIYDNIQVLTKQIAACDSEAIKVAYLLYPFTDGALTEELDICLGKTIKKEPYMFLIFLKRHRNKIIRLDGLLGNLGYEYVDKENESNMEIKLRIKALKRIKSAKLIKIRNECITMLNSCIHE